MLKEPLKKDKEYVYHFKTSLLQLGWLGLIYKSLHVGLDHGILWTMNWKTQTYGAAYRLFSGANLKAWGCSLLLITKLQRSAFLCYCYAILVNFLFSFYTSTFKIHTLRFYCIWSFMRLLFGECFNSSKFDYSFFRVISRISFPSLDFSWLLWWPFTCFLALNPVYPCHHHLSFCCQSSKGRT